MKRGLKKVKNFSGPSNLLDELHQNVSKTFFGRIIPLFFEISESDRVFNYLHDSNSIFWAGIINSEWVFGRGIGGGTDGSNQEECLRRRSLDPKEKPNRRDGCMSFAEPSISASETCRECRLSIRLYAKKQLTSCRSESLSKTQHSAGCTFGGRVGARACQDNHGTRSRE